MRATAPRGYNDPTSPRPSISPAHVPAGGQADAASAPSTPGRTTRTTAARARRRQRGNVGSRAVGLGNIDALISPGDPASTAASRSGSPSTATRQSRPTTSSASAGRSRPQYLRQAYEIARANPRIDLFTWFLLKDSAAGQLAIGPDHRRRPPETGVRRLRTPARRFGLEALAGADRDGQPVGGRRERARPPRVVRARRVVGEVEVEHEAAVRPRRGPRP